MHLLTLGGNDIIIYYLLMPIERELTAVIPGEGLGRITSGVFSDIGADVRGRGRFNSRRYSRRFRVRTSSSGSFKRSSSSGNDY